MTPRVRCPTHTIKYHSGGQVSTDARLHHGGTMWGHQHSGITTRKTDAVATPTRKGY